MSLRRVAAPLALAAWRATGFLRPNPPGAVRMLILHDVPRVQFPALAELIAGLQRNAGLITPAQAEARLGGHAPPDGKAPVLLTLDDGFLSNFLVAREILDPQGIKALFFVCPGLVDMKQADRIAAIGTNVFRGRRGAEGLDLMDWEQLKELAASGHEIGCHSARHVALAGLQAGVLEGEVGGAKARMAAVLGRVSSWFAFPFGDVASIDGAALGAIGRHFALCRSGVRGLAHAGSHPLALPAESVDLGAPPALRLLAAEGGMAPLYGGRLRRLEGMAP
ncbi:polysaccharide deacetylase family protein [Paramagnetospirillum magneticum]|uniref:Chitooligosaccharide deacetylase n=1 Tax=Paramagnetospirillum magneticum (strain ATCC 700264 / AMB-1) TaxID=342108 RepID=Q2WBC7_PARM1|nr:polysaccharide deacetylase family protein [Paramagnetospirillum magneticum]BAE48848.1 Predicted xylanase/chitin deacetylase [Paramagnetospirillum magneticum AMB-1]